MNHHSVALA